MAGQTHQERSAATVCRALAGGIASAIRAIVVGLAIAMLLVLALQVFMRFVMEQALSWSEEFALACFTWSMLLAMALGVRELIHVRMDVLVDHFPQALRSLVERACALMIALFGLFLAWSGYNYTVDAFGTTSAAIAFPMAYLYAAAPVCGIFTFLFALESLVLGPVQAKVQTQDEAA